MFTSTLIKELTDDQIAQQGGIVNVAKKPWNDLRLIDDLATVQLLAYACGLSSAVVSNNEKLLSVNLSRNQVAELDLSSNPTLRAVYCQDNRRLARLVLPPSVTVIQTSQCSLGHLNFLEACDQLVFLGCEDNGIEQVGGLLRRFPRLMTIELSQNKMSELDTDGNPLLQRYSLYETVGFIPRIDSNPRLRWLDFGNNAMPAWLVDRLLNQLADFGQRDGRVDFYGNAEPTPQSDAARARLLENGWTLGFTDGGQTSTK